MCDEANTQHNAEGKEKKQAILASCFVNLTQTESFGKRRYYLRRCHHQTGLRDKPMPGLYWDCTLPSSQPTRKKEEGPALRAIKTVPCTPEAQPPSICLSNLCWWCPALQGLKWIALLLLLLVPGLWAPYICQSSREILCSGTVRPRVMTQGSCELLSQRAGLTEHKSSRGQEGQPFLLAFPPQAA